MSPQQLKAIARELLEAYDQVRLIESFAARHADFDLDAAYQVAAELMRTRRDRGSRPIGRKIGFTNRSIWTLYGVDAPMWAHVYDDTVSQATDGKATVSLAGIVSPRMEPEILFKLREPVPVACNDPERLLRSAEWYAHSVEIVDSHFDWKFKLADAAADWACHARLVIGEPQPIREQDIPSLARALPAMKATDNGKGWGRIINVASVHGLVASAEKSAYVTAKHGLVGLTKVTALENATTGITCNAICPGYVRTPLVEGQIESQAQAHQLPRERVIREVILAAQPTKRFVEVEEVAALAIYLCGESASSITGAAIPIDGGWTAR